VWRITSDGQAFYKDDQRGLKVYVCICNGISEKQLRAASKKYCSVNKFLTSNNIKYECALCRSGLETVFKVFKEERKNEKCK